MRSWLLLGALLLAGCAGPSAAPSEAETAPPAYEPPAFSDTTGAIDGLIVSDEQLPIRQALVRMLASAESTSTDEQGRFAFGNLEPAEYVLQVDAPGYETGARKVTVLAGEVTSATIRLVSVASLEPYTSTAIFNGKTSCTISYRSSVNFLRPSCSAAAGPAFPNDVWNHNHPALAGFVDVLVETTWRPTYSYGNQLYQTVGGKPAAAFLHIKENESGSPLRILINQTEWSAWAQQHKTTFNETGGTVSVSTFAAHNLLSPPSPIQLGMVLDQTFTIFLTISYNGPMPAGLTRVPDS